MSDDETGEATVARVSASYVRHDEPTTRMQRIANRATAMLARPASLEEQRRDNLLLPSRADEKVAVMARPPDPNAALDRIEDAADAH